MQITQLLSISNDSQQLPIIRQSESTECGIACIAMLSAYYGSHHSMHSLRRRFGANSAGVTLSDLVDFASELNLQGTPCLVEIETGEDKASAVTAQLGTVGVPVILHWDADHFVVLNALKKERDMDPSSSHFGKNTWIATIHDPARGIVKYSLADMLNHFTGYVLICEPMPSFEKGDHREKIGFTGLWSKIRGFKSSLAVILMLSFVLQMVMMVSPYFVQIVMDSVLISTNHDLLLVLAIGFGALACFEAVTALVRGVSLNIFNNLFNVQLNTGLYRHLLRLPQQFFESRSVGDTLSRFHSMDKIRDLMVNGLLMVALDGIMSVMVLVLMLFYSPMLTLVIAGVLFVYLLIQWLSMSKNREFIEKLIHKESEISSQQIETIRAMQTIKLFNAQSARESKWTYSMNDFTKTAVAQGNFNEVIAQSARLLKALMHVIVVFMGAQMVMSGEFSAGMFLAFLAYKTMLADSSSNLITKFAEFKLLDVHFDRVSDVVCTPTEQVGDPASSSDPLLRGAIELRNVCFYYGTGSTKKHVLNDISLSVAEGESVAIVGPSGAGKTTLMKVMLGLVDASSGDVLYDGVPLNTFGLRKFRSQVSTVMQDDQLLSGTIIDNITFFDEHYDRKWAIQCAKVACIYDDIEAMPMSWQSLIGDMGSSLSGGQRQRLLLARALYRQPKIIFMDEATSHLDPQLERRINAAMRELSITRVVIAHRKETIDSADRVIEIAHF